MSRARYIYSNKNKSFSRTLMFTYGLLYLVFMVFVTSIGYYYYQKIIVEEKRDLYSVIASLVSESVSKVSYSGRYHSALLIEEFVEKNRDILYIILLDRDGDAIATAGLLEDEVESLHFSEQGDFANSIELFRDGESIPVEEIRVSFSGGFMDEQKGTIVVGISKKELADTLREGFVIFAVVFILLLIFGFYVLYVVSRYYGEPIKRLAYEFEGVLEYSPLLIVFYDKGGFVREASRNFISSFELGKNEENIYEIMAKYSVTDFAKEDESVFIDEQSIRTQSSFYVDEERRVFQVIKFPVLKDEGGVELAGAILNDITPLIEREEELSRSKEELEELNSSLEKRVEEELLKNREKDELVIRQSRLAAMGEMSSNMAHNWRQPLAVIGGVFLNLTDAYEDNTLTPDYFYKEIEKGSSTLKFLSKTIDNFRDFFKPSSKKSAFVVSKEIDKAVSFISSSLMDSNIELEYDNSCNCSAYGYPNEFSQVVLNILTNAKEIFLAREVENPKIIIRIIDKGEATAVEIEDNGGGVEAQYVDRVFEPYFSTKTVESGAGLGLFMSKIMIEKNMNGRLTFRNTQNGAIFRIEVNHNEQ